METSESGRGRSLGCGHPELSLRDYFAALSLSIIITTRPHENAERKALESYQIADAMMRQRERVTSGI